VAKNDGNVTLTGVSISDSSATLGSCTPTQPATLAPTETLTCAASHEVSQLDVNTGSYSNTATADSDLTDPATDTVDVIFTQSPLLGVAKRLVGAPVSVSTGVWDITFDIVVGNYGNVPITSLQVTDDLTSVFPLPSTFVVQSVSSTDFSVNWPGFNGAADTHLLAGSDTLDVGAQGTLTLVVRVTPAASGPFENTAIGSGLDPNKDPVSDESQNGTNPDPDGDGDPADNSDPSPIDFGANLFDPPYGIKILDAGGAPLLRWTVIWINNGNVVAQNVRMTDDIPVGSAFVNDGVPSGSPLPGGSLPAGSTTNGVKCEDASTITTTQYCYYEGPTTAHPRGRIIWQGTLGADFEVTDPAIAVHDIHITYALKVSEGLRQLTNTAVADADLNGDGDFADPGETDAARAAESWSAPAAAVLPKELPETGFAPGLITRLPAQPAALAYSALGDLWLEIPALKVSASIVGVPLGSDGWRLDWLGNQIGYLDGTAFPTWNGNTGLTAHVYGADGKPGPFVNLGRLRWGDELVVHAFGQRYVYEVRSNLQVKPGDMTTLRHEERPWLTLITCKGYDEKVDAYAWRVAVRAVLVRVEAEK